MWAGTWRCSSYCSAACWQEDTSTVNVLACIMADLCPPPPPPQAEREARMKEEKMRIGIEKMRIAHKKRVAIEVYNPDRSKKTGEGGGPDPAGHTGRPECFWAVVAGKKETLVCA